MKLLICLLVVPFAFAGLAKPGRRYIPEEEDPDFKRYIYIENSKGQIELIDLRETGNETTQRAVVLSDVQFDLYTLNNPSSPHIITNSDVAQLAKTKFDSRRLNIFVCHGWKSNRKSEINTLIRRALFGNHNVNLFVVDWSRPANALYINAKNYVVNVGRIVGTFINQMQSGYKLTGDRFVLIGHSLGAHVVGCAGANIKSKVGNIIGMDPAGPLFGLSDKSKRLDETDAKFVQIVHTNGALLGIGSSIGHVDFFPNGGMKQPGCGWDLAGICAHSKAYMYVAEAIQRGASVFRSVRCSDWNSFRNGRCAHNAVALMAHLQAKSYSGDFYLYTRDKGPFGLS